MTEKTAAASIKAVKEDMEEAAEKQETLETRLQQVEKDVLDIKRHLQMVK